MDNHNKSKYTWTFKDNIRITECYFRGLTPNQAHKENNHIKFNSMEGQ